jgi:ABC-type lipoprotein release transport system permease subunit
MLFEIRSHDAITLATVTGLLLTVALVATLIPARRAARVDPLSALRHE